MATGQLLFVGLVTENLVDGTGSLAHVDLDLDAVRIVMIMPFLAQKSPDPAGFRQPPSHEIKTNHPPGPRGWKKRAD